MLLSIIHMEQQMTLQLAPELVWQTLEKELFAVMGMVTAKGEARTVGIVYIVHDRKFYIGSQKDTWKVRHIRQNASVSLTVTIPKRIPFLPWVKIPAATITCAGLGRVLAAEEAGVEVRKALLRGLASDTPAVANMVIIEIQPVGEFVTYGVGVSLMTMRHPEQSRGRAAVK